MAKRQIKIVLDADVIIHFAKGGLLEKLPTFLPEYQFIVLDIVKREIPGMLLPLLETIIHRDKSISEEVFGNSSGERKEYFRLIAARPVGLALGKGESACMVYCKYHKDVVGSSNTKDVTDYCNNNNIIFLTTNDFLFYGIRRGIITISEATDFVVKIRNMGSYVPIVDFSKYVCIKI